MKLDNNTELPDRFVRHAASWVCRQLGVKVRQLNGLTLKLSVRRDAGNCSISMQTGTLSIGFVRNEPLAKRVWSLIHYLGWGVCRHAGVHDPNWHGRQVTNEYEKRPQALIDDWALAAGPRAGAVDTIVDQHMEYMEENDPAVKAARRAERMQRILRRRQTKARARLVEWERKRKLSNTKVKKYRAKVAYYDKKLDGERTDTASRS